MRDQKKETTYPFKGSSLSKAWTAALLLVVSLFITALIDAQAKEKAPAAGIKSAASSAPTAEKLGVPVYPGSTYDAQNSQGMSSGDYAYYIFVTNDAPEKVAAFYEQKLKVKAGKSGNSYLIPLKGRLPIPEEGISIQPNTLGGPSAKAKTMITFQKHK